MIMLKTTIIALSAASEAAAFVALYFQELWLAVFLHGIAALLAGVSVRFLSTGGKLISGQGAELVASIWVFTIPVFGLTALVLHVFPAWIRPRRKTTDNIIEFSMPRLSTDLSIDKLNETTPVERTLRTAKGVEQRVEAVASLRNIRTPDALRQLRIALKDESDEVRLLAHALLDQREHAIRTRIDEKSDELANHTYGRRLLSVGTLAALHKALAENHWELFYFGFVTGDQAAHTLQTAETHAENALQMMPDGATTVLLSRILIARSEYDRADTTLRQAESLGISSAVTSPLFAEIAFQSRRYEDVRKHLARASRAQVSRPRLARVVDYWNGSN